MDKYRCFMISSDQELFEGLSTFCFALGAMPVFDVSVEYFSGKTNPKWKLDQSSPNYTEISNLYTVAEKSKQLFTLENMPSVLGYRGFVLSDGKDTYVLVVGQKTVQLQKLLLESAPKGLLSSKLLSTLTTAIEKGIEPILTRRERRSTNYPPGNTWKDVKVLKCNNCYNYGTDRLSAFHRDRGLPGLGGGLVYTDPITPVNLRNSAVLDRLIVTPAVGGNIPVIPQHQQAARHLVALVVAQGKKQSFAKRLWMKICTYTHMLERISYEWETVTARLPHGYRTVTTPGLHNFGEPMGH
ncbi:hypothetical protein AC249_AIPGENE12846 [Exaiptasia diaphana]|nr:hypothetical protein AC249_AIPGENE12846 [Exaiptasia diaphana]